MTHAQPQKKSLWNMNVDLMHGPIFKSLLLFMLPILVSNLFQQLYNTVDTMIVGNVLGDTALAAIGSCGSIYELLVGFGIGIGNGLAIVAARSYGAQDHDLLKKTVAGSLVIGLVAITPGAGFVPIWSSYIIGALVSPICYFTMNFIKHKLKIDDALDAFGCHGIGGVWGGIATGLFAKTSINSVARWDGLVFGNVHLFVAQVLSIIITAAVAVVGTLICIGIIRIFTPLRVDQKEEALGLDISQHGENAYPSFNGFD